MANVGLIKYIITASVMGALTEALAYALALWLYHITWMRLINIFVIFGVIFGGLSWYLAGHGLLVQIAAGAALGVGIEIANDRMFKLWYFPGDPWIFLKGQAAVIGVGLSWAAVPPLVIWFTENMLG